MTESIRDRMLRYIDGSAYTTHQQIKRARPTVALPLRAPAVSVTDEKIQFIGTLLFRKQMSEVKLQAELFLAQELGLFTGFTDWSSLPCFPHSADAQANIDKGLSIQYIDREYHGLSCSKFESSDKKLLRFKTRCRHLSAPVLGMTAVCVEYVRQGCIGRQLSSLAVEKHPGIRRFWKQTRAFLQFLHREGCKALTSQGHDTEILFPETRASKRWIVQMALRVLYRHKWLRSYEGHNLDFL